MSLNESEFFNEKTASTEDRIAWGLCQIRF
jgi:hypothetical protein